MIPDFNCRSCGGSDVHLVLSLGETPLANSLLKADQLQSPEPTFPLDLAFCATCSLVQITFTVPPEELFSEYLYLSSFSDTMLEHARELAAELTRDRGLTRDSLVVEIASNDGYLLQNYVRDGIPVLGVEPARNIATVAEERGVPTMVEFFGREVAQRLAAEGRRADVIHAHNVLAHVADLNSVVAGFSALLEEDGLAVVEVPYVRDMIERTEFDTIYHEHLCYFSVTALDHLFRRHGLHLVDVRRVPIHGGSLQVRAAKREPAQPSVARLLEEERALGMAEIDYYAGFGDRVRALRRQLKDTLRDLKAGGARIAAYGASAKGSTLLNYMGIGGDLIEFVADRSLVKQGLYTPGTHLPILPPEALTEKMPSHALLLVWNFAEEVLRQQSAYREKGGRFIIPVPDVQVV
ncbi:MAG TPA: class I SAM-dependent methyltransferase [Candidatus Dormibacteraeota bacterium]